MRVFEIYAYNLKEIKFKDTKDFFDNLLKTINVTYSDIDFCFNYDPEGKMCQKVINRFPQLKEYKRNLQESERYFMSMPDYCLSSVRINEKGEIVKGVNIHHIDNFSALLKKIPNPINFGFMGVILDNVNWYNTKPQKSVFFSQGEKYDIHDHKFGYYFSNSIRFFKEFDFGNKLNLIEIMIERTVENDKLGTYPDAFKQFLIKLGNPKYKKLKCTFNDTEKELWLKASKKIDEVFDESNKKKCHISLKDESIENNQDYLVDSVTPITGFSLKSVFNKYAKKNGYKNFLCKNGCYRYKKITSNNHAFIVELMNIPFSLFVDASISVEGYNFKHIVCTIQQETVKNAVFAEVYAEKVFDLALELEKKYAKKLSFLYGETPEWYINA